MSAPNPWPTLDHDKRLLVAERLAVGDPECLAGSVARLDEEEVQALRQDPAFERLIQACRHIQQLSRADWRLRTEALLRGAAERALAEGRVSTVNTILRQSFVLDPSYDEEEKQPDWVTQGVLTGYRLKDIEAYDHDGLLDLLAIKEGPEAYERRMEQKRSRAASMAEAATPAVAEPEMIPPEPVSEPEPPLPPTPDVTRHAPAELPASPEPAAEPWPFKDEPSPEQRAREPRPRLRDEPASKPHTAVPEPIPDWLVRQRREAWHRIRGP